MKGSRALSVNMRNLVYGERYYVNIFLVHTVQQLSVPYAKTSFIFRKFKPTKLKDGEPIVGNLTLNNGKLSFVYKVSIESILNTYTNVIFHQQCFSMLKGEFGVLILVNFRNILNVRARTQPRDFWRVILIFWTVNSRTERMQIACGSVSVHYYPHITGVFPFPLPLSLDTTLWPLNFSVFFQHKNEFVIITSETFKVIEFDFDFDCNFKMVWEGVWAQNLQIMQCGYCFIRVAEFISGKNLPLIWKV